MNELKLKVGLVGTYQHNTEVDLALSGLKVSIKALEDLAEKENFDFYPIKEALLTREDAIGAARELEDKNIDFLLIQTSAYAAGELILQLSKINARLGLWAVPEPTQEGFPPLLSFTCMNMYGSIIGHYLTHYHISFKWFFGKATDELFLDRFKLTLRVLTALKRLANSRISLIGGTASGFYDLYFDERYLRFKYGISIFTNELSEVLQKAKQYDEKKVALVREKIKKEGLYQNIDPKFIDKTSRVYLALEEMARKNKYDALAISCWPKFEFEYRFTPCSTMGRLNENHIVAACEGDISAAISMLLLNYLSGKPSTMMDLASFDTKDNSLQMWHCGPSARSWADEKGVEYRSHFSQSKDVGEEIGMINNMIFQSGPSTIMRLVGKGEKMFLATAEIFNKKENWDGSRGWFGNLKILNSPASALDFINTIMVYRIPHHFPIARGELNNELMEVAGWLKLKPLEMVNYRDYIQNPDILK